MRVPRNQIGVTTCCENTTHWFYRYFAAQQCAINGLEKEGGADIEGLELGALLTGIVCWKLVTFGIFFEVGYVIDEISTMGSLRAGVTRQRRSCEADGRGSCTCERGRLMFDGVGLFRTWDPSHFALIIDSVLVCPVTCGKLDRQ